MGNMLESDSSGNSDIEIDSKEEKTRVRTAGDGMESLTTVVTTGGSNLVVADPMVLIDGEKSSSTQPEFVKSQTVIPSETSGIRNVDNMITISRSSSSNSFTTKEIFKSSIASISPKQLPAKNLLIPIKLVKCKPNVEKVESSSTSYDKFAAAGSVGKQKNPKFVPYEPYTCAIRPMMDTGHNKLHTRKPSDASSVASQSSTMSISDQQAVLNSNKGIATSTQLETSVVNPGSRNNIKSKSEPAENNNHQNSAALMKERLKIFEKEVSELQTENCRLKRMLVDSMAGTPTQTSCIMNKNLANGNAHRISESFDNLNDEIEVWRSKFLSSCVLVEQLNKDNQVLNGCAQSAAEILTDLKHSLTLTPRQYENVNEWFRQSKPLIRMVSLPDSNFSDELLADRE